MRYRNAGDTYRIDVRERGVGRGWGVDKGRYGGRGGRGGARRCAQHAARATQHPWRHGKCLDLNKADRWRRLQPSLLPQDLVQDITGSAGVSAWLASRQGRGKSRAGSPDPFLSGFPLASQAVLVWRLSQNHHPWHPQYKQVGGETERSYQVEVLDRK